jgi:hypothetical protein
MIRAEYREALESQHKILAVLWGVFIGGISLYLWIAIVFLAETQLAMAGSFSQTARFVLWLLALFDVATLMWRKRRFLIREANPRRREAIQDPASVAGAQDAARRARRKGRLFLRHEQNRRLRHGGGRGHLRIRHGSDQPLFSGPIYFVRRRRAAALGISFQEFSHGASPRGGGRRGVSVDGRDDSSVKEVRFE